MKKTIQIPIYKTCIIISDNSSEHSQNLGLDESCGMCSGCVWHSNGVIYFLYDPKSITIDILAHECVHIITHLFEIKGIRFELENDEPTAYLFEWIFHELRRTIFGMEAKK